MANMVSKMKNFLGFGDEDEDIDDFDDDRFDDDELAHSDDYEEESGPVIIGGGRNNKVVNIHTSASAKVIISKPMAYDDATEICDALKNRKIVVINTSSLENKVAQRLLDFVSGSCYALSGELQEIERGVYLLSPSNVEVTNELKTELSSKALFNWNK